MLPCESLSELWATQLDYFSYCRQHINKIIVSSDNEYFVSVFWSDIEIDGNCLNWVEMGKDTSVSVDGVFAKTLASTLELPFFSLQKCL